MTKVSSKVSPGMFLALFVKVKLVPGKAFSTKHSGTQTVLANIAEARLVQNHCFC